MTELTKFEAEVSLNQGLKRCKGSDDEDHDSEGNSNAKVERKQLKRFKENDEDFIKQSKDVTVELLAEKCNDGNEANSTASSATETCNQKGNEYIISSICKALKEAQEIFGIDCSFDKLDKYDDDSEENEEEKFKSAAKEETNSIDFDNEIRAADIPERMQLRSPPVSSATEEELAIEAQWIYSQAFERKTVSIQDAHLTAEAKERAKKGPDVIPKIIIVLELMRNQHLEVPFIAFYSKENVLPELHINDLWKIYKFDSKWCRLSQRRRALSSLFRQMKSYQDANSSLPQHARLIEEDDMEQLENVQTNEALNDFYRHFMLHYGPEISKMQNKEDHADYTDSYSVYRKAGFGGLAKKFGLSPKQFAKNLSQECQVHKVEQEPAIPCVLTLNYIKDKFQTSEEVLQAVQLMVAMQIAREPLVRESVRELYVENAKITVRPTKKGIELIDENHPICTMKYLKDKPVTSLAGDQYLKLAMAQDDQLITISFSDQVAGNYVERMKQLYCRNELDKRAQDWNNLRSGSVEIALTKMLILDLKKELHSTLLREAKDCVMRSCARKMYDWIKVAPYRCDYRPDDEWDATRGLRVMGVAYATDRSAAAFACIITPDGECADHLNLPNLLGIKNADKTTSDSVFTAIKNFIATKKPHVIAIGGESSDALAIAHDFRGVIASLVADEKQRHFPNVAVEIVENEPAVVYSNSRQAATEFSGYPVVLRRAISLARRLQDPLVEFSQLCNADDDILRLKFHSLQGQLPKEDLLDNVHLEFVNRVNEVGVDVNKALQRPYFGNLLQFVCGLGPRKARYLMDTLKQTNQRLENRQQLKTLCHMGSKLFANSAGFIKIDARSLSAKTHVGLVLDGSRVHPENYDFAGKIAADVLDYESEETNLAVALKEIVGSTEKLQKLDLSAYAMELARQGYGNKCITVYDIRSELTCRYKDLRIPYQSPTADKLFGFFSKKTPSEFYVGKLVEATIVGMISTGIICLRLDNSIPGYIHIKNLSDEHVANPKERVHIGSRIYCRVVKIETAKCCVEASSKGSDLADRNGEWRLPRDRYYDNLVEANDELVNQRARNVEEMHADAKSLITHRCFRNINYIDADKLMQTMQRGQMLIRPSSKGQGHYCFTWKVTDGVNQNVSVRDEGKGFLWIGDHKFIDLDDIIARYINPMAAYASELLNFKYYMPQIMGVQDKAAEILKERKKNNSLGIPYVVSAAKYYPGKFLLSYLPHDQCQHNYITITPGGLKFGGHHFTRFNDLIHWFKENSKDTIPEPTITPIAPRVLHTTLNITMNKISPERIKNITPKLPHSMLHSLPQVVNLTPRTVLTSRSRY